MRTARLVAEFRAINLGQQAAEFGWIKRPRCMEAFERTRNLLADMLAMTISQDYGNSDAILRQIDKAVDDPHSQFAPLGTERGPEARFLEVVPFAAFGPIRVLDVSPKIG
jgi:hypothetical protein